MPDADDAWGLGVADDWASSLRPVAEDLRSLRQRIRAERERGIEVLPPDQQVLAAFHRPLAGVRVLIVGQDPYPTPGHAVGLAFATSPQVRPIPRSLANVYRERASDLGIPPAAHGDLTAWAAQGVLLLNRVLTVRAGGGGLAPRPRLGTGHGVRDPRARGAARAARGGALGRGRSPPRTAARGRPRRRECPPLAALRLARLLRVAAV